jgi:hypothetical protein
MMSSFAISCALGKRRAHPLHPDYFTHPKHDQTQGVSKGFPSVSLIRLKQSAGFPSANNDGCSEDDDESTGYSQSQVKYKLKDHGPKIQELKEIIKLISEEDKLDLNLYSSLDPDQKRVIDAIFRKRYKPEIFVEIANGLANKVQFLETFKCLQPKRMDHCEKSSMSIKLGLVKDTFITTEYGKRRPKDLRDDINRTIFKKYFHDCINPDQLVEVSKGSGEEIKPVDSDMMPRRSAIFCMKKGLTKCWFKSISSKFLNMIMSIKVDQVKRYYFDRFLIKLDEIFGWDNESMDGYYDKMIEKINSKKFKLPLTSKELEKCEEKANKKIKKLKVHTFNQEHEDFKAHFQDDWFKHHQEWENNPQQLTMNIFQEPK